MEETTLLDYARTNFWSNAGFTTESMIRVVFVANEYDRDATNDNAVFANNHVRYQFVDMYHIGLNSTDAANTCGLSIHAPYRVARGQERIDLNGNTGRIPIKLFPTKYETPHMFGVSHVFNPAEWAEPVREGIGGVRCQFTGQPVLELELIDLSPVVKIQPVQALWCPT